MKMKKVLCVVLVLTLALAMTACGSASGAKMTMCTRGTSWNY